MKTIFLVDEKKEVSELISRYLAIKPGYRAQLLPNGEGTALLVRARDPNEPRVIITLRGRVCSSKTSTVATSSAW